MQDKWLGFVAKNGIRTWAKCSKREMHIYRAERKRKALSRFFVCVKLWMQCRAGKAKSKPRMPTKSIRTRFQCFNSNSCRQQVQLFVNGLRLNLNSQGQDRILAECASISTTSTGSLTPKGHRVCENSKTESQTSDVMSRDGV